MCLYGEIKPKLTRSQRALCEAIGIGWLARNKVECSLRWHSEKPKRDMSDGCYKSPGTERIIGVPFPEFPFVKWEDEPYSIEEMLKWEVDGADTIYRQTAIEAVSNLASSMSVCLNIDECHGMKRMQEMAVMVLSRLQSAESEQVRTSVSLADCISRQAAIDALDGTRVDEDEEYCNEYAMGYNDGIDFSVSKLSMLPSAEPELPFEIQNILDYLDTTLHPIISPEHWDVYSKLHDMISTLPSAEPERKHGHWIDTINDPICFPNFRWKCSECWNRHEVKTDFCEDCGARMDGEQW